MTSSACPRHPQAHQIHDKAQTEGVACRLVVADGCIHVYPLMPIPEARRAIEMIVDFIATSAAETHEQTTSSEPVPQD